MAEVTKTDSLAGSQSSRQSCLSSDLLSEPESTAVSESRSSQGLVMFPENALTPEVCLNRFQVQSGG